MEGKKLYGLTHPFQKRENQHRQNIFMPTLKTFPLKSYLSKDIEQKYSKDKLYLPEEH